MNIDFGIEFWMCEEHKKMFTVEEACPECDKERVIDLLKEVKEDEHIMG